MSRRGRVDRRVRTRIRERGAVMVEAALVAPIVVALVFGAMELGYAYYGKLTIEHMSIAGARAASGSANDYLADHNVLEAVEDAATGMENSSITKIIVYRSTGPGDRVPPACKNGPVTNTSSTRGCNVYTGADISLESTEFGCVGPPGPSTKIDNYWCPTTRKSALQATNGNGPPDYVGVYVEGKHKTLVGVPGDFFTFSNDTVIRIEPRALR